MSTISRIVLDAETRSVVDAIQARTRTTSPSAAIALMIGRYGRHLLETWELSASRYPEPSPEQSQPASAIAPAAAVNDFQFSDPINF